MPNQREILVVEDNPADVRLIREALRELPRPVNIHVANDGDEALQFLRRQGKFADAPRPSLMFLDYNLPKANSREILATIKRDPRMRVIPVAVFTTSDSERDIREAYDLHANCYLRKPIDLDTFFDTIRVTAHFWLDIAYTPSEPREDAQEG